MKYVIIPSRLNSSRFPRKALLPINGIPMVVQVFRQALEIPGVEQVLVATDSEEIADAVQKHGGIALMTYLPHRNGTERCAEIARQLSLSAHDVVLNLQGDIPFINPESCSHIMNEADNDRDSVYTIASICSGSEVHDRDNVKVVCNKANQALYFSRSPMPGNNGDWLKHVGAYAMSNSLLQLYSLLSVTELERREDLEQLRFMYFGVPIKVHITDAQWLSINNEFDCSTMRRMNIVWPEQTMGHVI